MTELGRNLTAARLRELIYYDPIAGTFTWRVTRSKARAGKPAGVRDGDGYLLIRIDGVLYRACRLAWFYVHSVWPEKMIDHKNLDKGDDRLCNLREANDSQNNSNRRATRGSASGLKGVSWYSRERRWVAAIKVNGKRRCLGYFRDPKAAHRAYVAAISATHGEFGRAE